MVYRIGEMKALDFYHDYLGEHSKPAAEFPLAVNGVARRRIFAISGT